MKRHFQLEMVLLRNMLLRHTSEFILYILIYIGYPNNSEKRNLKLFVDTDNA